VTLSDTPPVTPPYFCDLALSRPDGEDPAEASRFIVDNIANVPELSPLWRLEDGPAFTLRLLDHERSCRTVLAIAEIGLSIVLETHVSGYVRVTARRNGEDLLRAWLDRPYEEYDLWPSGAIFPERRTYDAPGRIGKRLSWIVLDTRVWPALSPLANDVGFIQARVED
jgi:hypothetical protein